MSLGRPISVNDDPVEQPRIRSNQQRRCTQIVRAAASPTEALRLLTEYASTFPDFSSTQLTTEHCIVHLRSSKSRMRTAYKFALNLPVLIDSPNLH